MLLQPITVQFSKSTLKPSVYTLSRDFYMWSSKNHFVEHSLCYNLVKTRSQYYFSIQSYGILKTGKTSNLKAHNNEKMAVNEKEPYFNII